MATSNRERIGQMFDALAPALNEFITRVLSPHLSPDHDWSQLVALKDSKNGISGKLYSAMDPLLQLRMLTENIPHQVKPGWFPFDGQLSKVQQSYASELRDVRNKWAHGSSFNNDDAYRALDTAERLLAGIGAAEAAAEVAKIRLNLRRVTAEKTTAARSGPLRRPPTRPGCGRGARCYDRMTTWRPAIFKPPSSPPTCSR
jgi:hypothetical protein